MTSAVMDRPDVAVVELLVPEKRVPCDFRPCPHPAVLAVLFTGLKETEHSHVCKFHVREAREFYDVCASHALPCPYPHMAHVGTFYRAPKLEV